MTKRIDELFDIAVARASRSAQRPTIADTARDGAKLMRDAAMSHRTSATRRREQSAAARYRWVFRLAMFS
jgi:hypothetical protein